MYTKGSHLRKEDVLSLFSLENVSEGNRIHSHWRREGKVVDGMEEWKWKVLI